MIQKMLLIACFAIVSVGFSQEKLYNPDANAKQDIENAVTKANEENKYVILQVGGNWCSWCILFHKYSSKNEAIKKIIDENFVFYHLNYSKENKNLDILQTYNNPQRFGFPVFLVLNSKGELIHTQDSGYLESCTEKGYDQEKVERFLNNWKKSTVEPKPETTETKSE